MSKFEKGWTRQEREGFATKTKDTIRGPQPLKPQIQKASGQLQQEVSRLDGALSRLKQREQSIFKKTVSAVQAHDEQTSKAYSNELADIKKMTKIVTQSKIALEQITMRLQTVTDVGDFAATLSPAIGVIRTVRTTLGQALPDAQSALGEIGTQLNSIMVDVGQITGMNFHMGETSEEAEKIMAEAAAIAEKRMGDTFPEVPSATNESVYSSSG